jgi:FkbM family methyltransferase
MQRRVRSKISGVGNMVRLVWSHPSNVGAHRLVQLARAASFEVRSEFVGPCVVTTGWGSKMLVDPAHHASTRVVHARFPDCGPMRFWSSFLRPGDVFVDVGANVGLYSTLAVSRGAEVRAYEPDPLAIAQLRGNLSRCTGRFTALQSAVGDRSGVVRFTSGRDEMNHVVTHDDEGEHIGTVQQITLDQELARLHIRGVKVDVEGIERLVIDGAASLLSTAAIDVMQLEWNWLSRDRLGEPRTVVRGLLAGHGYRLARARTDGRLDEDSDPVESAEEVFAVSPRMAGSLFV